MLQASRKKALARAPFFMASRQTVNKELRTLEQMGVIKAAYGRVTIHDLEALRQAAGG